MLTRTFLSFILIISLVTIFTSCEKVTQQIPQSMEAQLALLPADANALGYVNVKKVHESDFVNTFLDSAQTSPFAEKEYQDFVKATGLDVQKDINEVYFAVKLGELPREKVGLVVINGNFDPVKIIEYIRKESKSHVLNEDSYDDYTIYKFAEDDTITFSFISNAILLAGSEDNITAWIDKSSGKSNQSANELITQVEKIKYKDTAWFTMDASLITEELKKKDIKKFKSLESLKSINLSINLIDKFKFFGESEFSSGEQAELFYDAIKGFIAAGKLSTSDDREIVDILNSITVNHENEQVTINIEFTKEDIKKLLDKKDSIAPNILTAL
ncbi:MAG: hypothetical protein JW956_00460 [Calditrichaceae bacterium]|nr:hypothetical protein [Calditrichaceae bacterium]